MVTAATRRGRTIRSNVATEDVSTDRLRRDRRCRGFSRFRRTR